jgi:hypothetical protein
MEFALRLEYGGNRLYMAALLVRRCNPVIKAFAERLKAAGKPPKVVIVGLHEKSLDHHERHVEEPLPLGNQYPLDGEHGCSPAERGRESGARSVHGVVSWLSSVRGQRQEILRARSAR